MKKSMFALGVLCCSVFTACGKKETPSVPEQNLPSEMAEEMQNEPEETSTTEENLAVQEEVQSEVTESEIETESWQEIYIEYLNGLPDKEGSGGYNLIYLDADNVPELVDIGTSMAEGCRIINYSDGEVHETQLDRLYFTYIERKNLLCNSDGNMDHYYDLVYSIQNGEMVLIAEGYYGAEDNSNIQFDEEGLPIYQYKWNGVSMTEEEYQNALNEVYDTSQAKAGYQWEEWYSKEEMIQLLNDL